MEKLKRLLLLMLCLVIGMTVLTACSAGDPTGTWYLTDIKNDASGEMNDILALYDAMGLSICCDITRNSVSIYVDGYDELMAFNYRKSGSRMIDTYDDSVVSFKVSGDTLTLYFEDCDMIFTRAR